MANKGKYYRAIKLGHIYTATQYTNTKEMVKQVGKSKIIRSRNQMQKIKIEDEMTGFRKQPMEGAWCAKQLQDSPPPRHPCPAARSPSPRRPPAPPHLPSAPRGGPPEVAEPSLLPGGSGGARCLPPALRYRRDQVPPLLPLQLRPPPPPPPPPCMTQQNRSCCSKSQPSAQEAPQPGVGRGRGRAEGGVRGRGVERARGLLAPDLALHTPLPSSQAREEDPAPNPAGRAVEECWGLASARDGTGRSGVKTPAGGGRTLKGKKGKKRPRSPGPVCEGELRRSKRSYLPTSLPDTNKFLPLSATKP
ncbi:uncharacterized protein LOC129402499 [Sorex araneus]|uniref:uncharacterized protein LOC129402499 n=1 Tax=Sorex araneus TaxID=42254 RepID=UPI002433B2BF|nr:uncharacterized protein LOC129402499 [Sorex araneus]